MEPSSFRPPTRLLIAALLLLTLAAGLHARFGALGKWALFDDEFYQSEAALTWMREGAPRLPTGGYYTRGILYQIASMGSVTAFGDTEFAHRLPAAIAGLLLAVASYALARARVGRGGALVVAAVTLLSSWHIAFARTARMYSMLALLSATYFGAIEWARTSRRTRAWLLAGACVAATIFVHASSAILAMLFVLTTVSHRAELPARRRPLLIAGSIVLCLAAALSTLVDLWPASVASQSDTLPGGQLTLPRVHTLAALFAPPALRIAWLAYAVLFLASARAVRMRAILWPAVVCGALLQPMFGACYVILICFLQPGVAVLARRRDIGVLAGGFLAAGGLILAAGHFAGDPEAATYAIDAPRLYWDAWRHLRKFLPGTALVALACLMFRCARALRHGFEPARDGLAMSVLLGFIGVASIRTAMPTARYIYFLYVPLIVVAIETIFEAARHLPTASRLARDATASLVVALLFALSMDCWPTHWLKPASPEIYFRLGKYHRFRQDWYRHFDYRALASAAEREIRPGETLAVTPKAIAVARYFDRGRMISIAFTGSPTGIPQPDGELRELYVGLPQTQGAAQILALVRERQRLLVCGGYDFDVTMQTLLAGADEAGLTWRILYVDPSGSRSLYELLSNGR